MSKMKKQKTDTVEITGKCILCGKKEVLTSAQIREAEISGAAASSCCYFPMTIEKVSAKFANNK